MWMNCPLTDLHPELLDVETQRLSLLPLFVSVLLSLLIHVATKCVSMYLSIVEEYTCECMPIKDKCMAWSGCWLDLRPWHTGSLISARLWDAATCSEFYMHLALCVT